MRRGSARTGASKRSKSKKKKKRAPLDERPDAQLSDEQLLERARREALAAQKERDRLRRIAEVEAADRRWARESGRRASKRPEAP